jgi:hypothetical protein
MKGVAIIPRSMLLTMLLAVLTATAGCRAIEGIFKAGVWVGVVIAVFVVAVILAIVKGLSA